MSANFLIAEIPIGQDGFNGHDNKSLIPVTALLEANNITLERGLLQKDGGAALYTTTTPALATDVKIIGGFDWIPSGSTQTPVLFLVSGTVKRDDGTGAYPTTMATALTGVTTPQFVEGGKEAAGRSRKMFIFTGVQPVQVMATTSLLATMSQPAADWLVTAGGAPPAFGLVHEQRLWAGGNSNDPHRLYYSTASDHENVSGGGSLSIFPGEGERLVGAISFKKVLVAFKRPRGIYFVDTSNPTASNWKVYRHNANVGLAGKRAITQVDLPDHDDVLFLDSTGLFRLLSQVSDESYGTREISSPAGMDVWMRANANFSALENARMVFYPAKREVHCAIPEGSATALSERIVIDLNRPGAVRYRLNDRDAAIGDLWLQRDSVGVDRLTMGDETGRVYRLDQETRAKAGVAYIGQFQTPHHDFGFVDSSLSLRRKRFKFVEIEHIESGNHELFMDVYIDERYSETISFNMGSLGDEFTYTFPIVFRAEGRIRRKRRRIRGSGYRISLVGRNDGAAEDFKITRMFIGFSPANQELPI